MLILLIIPAFILLIWIEYKVSKIKKIDSFDFNSSIVNVCIGIAERLSDLFFAGVFYAGFSFIHKNYGLLEIETTVWTYLLLLIAADFLWYWYHRLGHEINIFWAAHIVHHQSEDYNFTVSARITVLQSFIRFIFWSVLPLAGFNEKMVAIIIMVHGLYSFFVHTRVIGKLGVLEKIFVTPSHHRVHHASNEKYLDKNYGNMFIFWDKIFGTFAEEKEAPVYGLTTQLKSHSFLWQHFHSYLELWETVKLQQGWQNKFLILFKKPDSISYEVRQNLETRFLFARNNEKSSGKSVGILGMRKYNLIQIGISFILLIFLQLKFKELSPLFKFSISFFTFITLINICAILERRVWIVYLEYIRIIIVLVVAMFYFDNVYIYSSASIITVLLLYNFALFKKMTISFIYGPIFYNRIISA